MNINPFLAFTQKCYLPDIAQCCNPTAMSNQCAEVSYCPVLSSSDGIFPCVSQQFYSKSNSVLDCFQNPSQNNSSYDDLSLGCNLKSVGNITDYADAPKFNLVDKSGFSSINPGDLVYFAHVNKFAQLAISRAQDIFGFGDKSMNNVTHVGVVTDVNKDSIKVAEISGYGKSLSEVEYHLKDLYKDEELLFTRAPSKYPELNEQAVKIGKLWGKQHDNENQYNLKGLAEIPLKSEDFNPKDKDVLLNDLIDSRYLNRSPHVLRKGELQPKQYFCSEYALQIQQLARLEKELGPLPHVIDQQLTQLNLDKPLGRTQAIKILQKYTEEINVWEKLRKEPFFKHSSEHTTPSSLISMAMAKSDVVRVRNPNALERFNEEIIPNEKLPSFLEFSTTKILDRFLKGEEVLVKDKDVQKLLDMMENQSGYNKETLGCFLDKCAQSAIIPKCIEECLENTLSLKEKLFIYLFSRQINRATDSLLHNPTFVEFIKNPSKQKLENFDLNSWEFSANSALELSFPTASDNVKLFSKIENYFIKKMVNKIDLKTLIKYIPLSVSYSPPTETMKQFLKETDIDTVSIALKMHEFLSIANLGYKTYSGESNGLEFLWKGLSRLGWIQKENPLIKTVIDKLSFQTGYTKETLNCVVDKMADPGIKASDVENCLANTLTMQEKTQILASSVFINQGVENLLKNDDFKTFIREGTTDNLKNIFAAPHKEEAVLDFFFPSSEQGWLSSIQNYAAKAYFSSALKEGIPRFIFKDVFLGLAYDSPSESIQKFLVEEKLTKEDLVIKIAKWLGVR